MATLPAVSRGNVGPVAAALSALAHRLVTAADDDHLTPAIRLAATGAGRGGFVPQFWQQTDCP
jgi:hypothetical protein